MTLANYPLWEADHILPVASFDLSNAAQQRACFNHRNIQPLWLTPLKI